MNSWFDYRAERALRMRRDGWSLDALALHFEVPVYVVRIWLDGPRKKRRPKRKRHHCGYRETGSRNNSEHDARVAAHRARVLAEEC